MTIPWAKPFINKKDIQYLDPQKTKLKAGSETTCNSSGDTPVNPCDVPPKDEDCQQGWVDFNEHITRTQVSSIVYGEYSLSTCKTLIQEGLCSGLCIYYDKTAGDLV